MYTYARLENRRHRTFYGNQIFPHGRDNKKPHQRRRRARGTPRVVGCHIILFHTLQHHLLYMRIKRTVIKRNKLYHTTS